MRTAIDIADAMVLIVGWKLIGIIERIIWDSWKAERGKQSMKAFEQDSIKGGMVCK